MERTHVSNIADLHANQRIKYQKLEDDKLNFDRNLSTLEMEVNDVSQRLKTAKGQLELKKTEHQLIRVSKVLI